MNKIDEALKSDRILGSIARRGNLMAVAKVKHNQNNVYIDSFLQMHSNASTIL
jgi:thiamine biosynthesis protein ThiC